MVPAAEGGRALDAGGVPSAAGTSAPALLQGYGVRDARLRARTERVIRACFLADGGGSLVATLVVVNVGNLAFHVAVTRLITPASYGALVALLGGLLVIVVPLAAAQAAFTSQVAACTEATGGSVGSIRAATGRCTMWSLAAMAVVAVLARPVQAYLHLSSPTPVLLLALFLAPAFVGLVPKALLLGQRRFRAVAAALLAGVGARLVSGVVMTGAGFGIGGAVGATAVGEGVTCCVLLGLVRPALARPTLASDRSAAWHLRPAGLLGAIGAFGGYWALVAIDPMLARHYLTDATSGAYGAASAAARAALFLPGAVALVAFPTFAATGGRGPQAHLALRHALLAVSLLGAGAATVVAAFPSLAVEVLFGHAYVGPPAVVRLLALSSAMASLVCILLHFHVASRSRAALLSWAGVVAALVATRIWHASARQVAAIMAASATGVVLAMLAAVRERPTSAGPPDGATAVALHSDPSTELSVFG